MQKERLVIKNFGPIKSIDLELGKMTILIGDQATGKSTIAKVLAVCRYFSYFNVYDAFGLKSIRLIEIFINGLKDFDIDSYIKYNSELFYENNDYSIKFEPNKHKNILVPNFNDILYKDKIFNIRNNLSNGHFNFIVIAKSDRFRNLLNILEQSKPWNKDNDKSVNFEHLTWYPSEDFFRINVKNVMDNPLFIPIERILQGISFNEDLLLSKSTQRQIRKINRIYHSLANQKVQFNYIDIIYKRENNINYIKKNTENEFYPLSNSASGFQALTPITLGVKYYSDFVRKPKTFIIEEPENNLFPKTQKKLMEFFVENINLHNHQFLLPTHSPYILSSINDLLMAYKKGQKFENEVINLGYKKEIWLNPNNLSVYQLEDGFSKNILNNELGLIDNNIIDAFSDELNDSFDNLLDIE